uniref:Translocon-associated protein subunit alpha n=1 Tax=Alona affinis TaxID=381656 RepID=A0A9N6WPF7_9CRUS|nr:EOG090X0ETF [Alona affinis]
MIKLLSRTWILLLSLALIATLAPTGPQGFSAFAQEDELDNDDDAGEAASEDAVVTDEGSKTDDDDTDDVKMSASPDAETMILFTKPSGPSSSGIKAAPSLTFHLTDLDSLAELPAGQIAEFLIGFTNKGAKEMVIDSVEAAFHYPMDHSFVIQNFSAIQYGKVVRPGQQATVAYSFIPAEPFVGRPFGLSVNMAYRDAEIFCNSVFNETINIIEVDEGLDGETFFLYLFLAAGIVLLLVLGQQALASMGKRRGGGHRVETGTSRNTGGSVSDDGIDYDWLPQSTINELNKSPKGSPRRSPRLRKTKGGSGSD